MNKLSPKSEQVAGQGQRAETAEVVQRHGRGCPCTPCQAEDWDKVDALLARYGRRVKQVARAPLAGRGSHDPLTDEEVGERLYLAEQRARALEEDRDRWQRIAREYEAMLANRRLL